MIHRFGFLVVVAILVVMCPFSGYSVPIQDKLVQKRSSKTETNKVMKGIKRVETKQGKLVARSRKPKRKKEDKKKQNVDSNKNDLGGLSQEDQIYKWFKTYSEVVSLTEKKSFTKVDFSKFIQSSLKSAVADVDAHSSFFSQEAHKSAMESTSGEFSGIGVSIIGKTPEDEALLIVDVIEGGPAHKAGLKGGDKVVSVEDEKLRGMTTDEVINKLKGKVGSKVKVKLLRDKKPLELTITRDIIKDQTSISYKFTAQNIYYLSLKMFTENAAKQMEELLIKANAGKCRGVVLDLRRNPGGTLHSAIDMAGLFVEKKSLVVETKDKDQKTVEQYFTSSDPVLKTDVPIFILIDNFTASAAEILAGTLKYHSIKSYETSEKKNGRKFLVFLVGTSTFGKGSVQEVIPISNGCALKLTTMVYQLPGDQIIQAKGIEPDFTIKPKYVPVDEMKWIEEMYGKESSLKNHITNDQSKGIESPKETDKKGAKKKDESEKDKSSSPGEWEKKRKETLGHDIQVQAAVNMITVLDFARKCQPKLVSSREKALTFLKEHYLTDDPVLVEKVK